MHGSMPPTRIRRSQCWTVAVVRNDGPVAVTPVALLAVKWMVAYLNRHGMEIFGYYRIALAVGVAVLILLNLLQP